MRLDDYMIEKLCWMAVSVCTIAALALPVFVYLYLSARAETRQISLRITEETDSSLRLAQLEADFNQLKAELKDHAGRSEKPVAAEYSPGAFPINLNKRGQILQLHRRGDSVSCIAQVLHLAKAEVRLVIRVHELSVRPDAQDDFSV
jgi:hypothetical protein